VDTAADGKGSFNDGSPSDGFGATGADANTRRMRGAKIIALEVLIVNDGYTFRKLSQRQAVFCSSYYLTEQMLLSATVCHF